MRKIAVLLSGSGSNFQAIAEHFSKIEDIEIALCISNKKNAFGLERARKMNIKDVALELKDFEDRKSQEKVMSKLLKDEGVELIVLAGYMLIFRHDMLDWEGKIINIHPSLLPKFPGVHGIEDTFNSKEEYGGVTIHYVDSGMDTGSIIKQASIKIDRTKNLENYEKQIHDLEHKNYPQTIEEIIRSK